MSGLLKPLSAAAAGAVASLSLWALDLLALRQLQFAGVRDAATQERVYREAGRAISGLELRLCALHLVCGAVIGLLLWMGLEGYGRATRLSRARLAGVAFFFTLAFYAVALFGMMARYPQLYADAWWLRGGWRAWLQRLATHGFGPRPFDAMLGLTVAALVVGGAFAVVRALTPAGRRRAAGLALLLLLAALPRRGPAPSPAQAPLSVLILASDSLRTDRLEDPAIMPFSASLRERGTLFRQAFTPVARTFPSWVSTLTGLEPRQTGVRTMFPRLEPRQRLAATFVAGLRDQGFRTWVVSDFAGDIFPRFPSGFAVVDTPNLTADTLARATVFSAHAWSLPLLRLPVFRALLPEWRNLASLSDPEWLVDRALAQLEAEPARPFVGLVFFSTPHFPYVAPYPDYLLRSDDYRGRYLYHAPPTGQDEPPSLRDIEQIRARYDGALRSADRATERLFAWLGARGLLDHTVVVITGDHGEELYEEPGVAGHGDVIGAERSQVVPILMLGPGVPTGRTSDAQVRLYDLAPTLLSLLGRPSSGNESFGDGISLFREGAARPICVETGIWFFPDRPEGLRGRRLQYPGIAELLEVEPTTRELVLRRARTAMVESAKRRGLILGARLWEEELTPTGPVATLRHLPSIVAEHEEVDLRALFDERCVSSDPDLRRFFGAVVSR